MSRDENGKLQKEIFLHTHPNLVVTTLANNSLKYRNPPPVHWLDLAFFTCRYHNGRLWRGERYDQGGSEHPSLIVVSRLLLIQILIYRVWIMPCDWIYRVVIRISCFIIAFRMMELVSSILKLGFVNPTPSLSDMLQGDPDEIAELAQQEEERFQRKWRRNPDPASDEFYTVRRGAAARARVVPSDERKLRTLSAEIDEEARTKFNISLRKTKDGAIAVGTLALESAEDIVRFFKKDGLNKIAPFLELYAHFCWTHIRHLLELNGNKPYGRLVEFVTGSYHCQSLPFALPFESKTPYLPSPSRLDHSDLGSNDPAAHVTGFERGVALTWGNFEAKTRSNFVWDSHVLNQGFMKATPAEMPVMVGYWGVVAQRVVGRHPLVREKMPVGWEERVAALSEKLRSVHSTIIKTGGNKIERIGKGKGKG